MPKKFQIQLNGKSYPCRPTMGAMLRFHQLTDREVSDIRPDSISDLLTYLYCCVASASKADQIPFEWSLMDFADAIMPDDLNQWAASLSSSQQEAAAPMPDSDDEQKKSR